MGWNGLGPERKTVQAQQRLARMRVPRVGLKAEIEAADLTATTDLRTRKARNQVVGGGLRSSGRALRVTTASRAGLRVPVGPPNGAVGSSAAKALDCTRCALSPAHSLKVEVDTDAGARGGVGCS